MDATERDSAARHCSEQMAALALVNELPEPDVRRLTRRFGSFSAAASVLPRAQLERARAELRAAEGKGFQLLPQTLSDYPSLLHETGCPPLLLWVRGDRPVGDPAVAVVGARRATVEGLRIARAVGAGLAELGVTVVSGLARGIDAAAHRGAIEAGGTTAAVLGSGLEKVYPREHARLAEEVARHGLVMSQFPLAATPLRHHFPVRNRVIAGLVRAVVVIEAAERSGSLITARAAVDENRAVLAVPGSPLSPTHRGSNRLLAAGARLLLELGDILDELPPALRPSARRVEVRDTAAPETTPSQDAILAVLQTTRPSHPDELAEQTGLAGHEIAVALVHLEITGRVTRVAGGRYLRLAPVAPLYQTQATRPGH